jgi:hypothetical protein
MSTVTTLLEHGLDTIRAHPQIALGAFLALVVLSRLSRRPSGPNLQGPPSTSWIFGVLSDILNAVHGTSLYEAWYKIYGPVYQIPLVFGTPTVVLLDPKALATVLTKDTSTYHQNSQFKTMIRRNVSI